MAHLFYIFDHISMPVMNFSTGCFSAQPTLGQSKKLSKNNKGNTVKPRVAPYLTKTLCICLPMGVFYHKGLYLQLAGNTGDAAVPGGGKGSGSIGKRNNIAQLVFI